MKHLKKLLNKPLQRIPRWAVFTLIVISFIGFLDAVYLTAGHYLDVQLPCSVLKGCEQVAASKYAMILGIPVSLGGVFYYLVVLVTAVAYIDIKKSIVMLLILPATALGFLFSVWFVYLQLFVIKAICPYCMLSAAASTILFIVSVVVFKQISKPTSEATTR